MRETLYSLAPESNATTSGGGDTDKDFGIDAKDNLEFFAIQDGDICTACSNN